MAAGPATPAGRVAFKEVLDTAFTPVAGAPPTVTVGAGAILKPVPVIVISVPPADEAIGGSTFVIVGGFCAQPIIKPTTKRRGIRTFTYFIDFTSENKH
jgi:hypothetical protein